MIRNKSTAPDLLSRFFQNSAWRSVLIAVVVMALVACNRSTADANPKAFRYLVVDHSGPREPWGKSCGDLSGDGRADLIVGGRAGGGLVWYENPAWRKRVISEQGEFSTDHEVADVDRDGRNDVVSLTISSVVWFRNPDWQMNAIDHQRLHDIEVADLDGDGRIDVVGRNQSAFGGGGDRLFLYLQRADGGWDKRTIDLAAGEGLKLADLDRDGRADIVLNGTWLRNPGSRNGEWKSYRFATAWSWPHVAVDVGDINGDGRPDIVMTPSELAGNRYRISWFEAPADPTRQWLEHPIELDAEAVHHFVGLADFDLDGRVDVASAVMHQGKAPHEVKIYHNQGSGREWSKRVVATTGSHNMRIVDIDGDGDPDLFGANWSGGHQAIEIWINQACSPAGGRVSGCSRSMPHRR